MSCPLSSSVSLTVLAVKNRNAHGTFRDWKSEEEKDGGAYILNSQDKKQVSGPSVGLTCKKMMKGLYL